MKLTRAEINTAVRLVDNWRERTPGTIDGKALKLVGIQKQRRLRRLFRGRIKYYIYLQVGTEAIWYKRKRSAVGIVKMGFSVRKLMSHPKAVPAEFYYAVFTSPEKVIPVSHLEQKQQETIRSLDMTGTGWLAMNDYELASEEA